MAQIDNNKTIYCRKGQPHIQPIGATFSVTFITNDAIPKQVLVRLIERKKTVFCEIDRDALPEKWRRKQEINCKFDRYLEKLLHAKSNQEHLLRNPVAATEVANRLELYAGKYYDLLAYSIMSNHVHLLADFSIQCPKGWNGVDPLPDYVNLAQVLNFVKGGSSYDANKAVGRKGKLWNAGYYDRYIRDQKHLAQEFRYVVRNPEAAGLVDDWNDHPFTFGEAGLVEMLLGG